MNRRVVLYPQGIPSDSGLRQLCEGLVLSAGGDLRRVIELPGASLATFIAHAQRLPALRSARGEYLVVLSRAEPAGLALPTRRALCGVLPQLEQAAWAIFWDQAAYPKFAEQASGIGKLLHDPGAHRVWTPIPGQDFIVLAEDTAVPSVALPSSRQGPIRESGYRLKGPARNTG